MLFSLKFTASPNALKSTAQFIPFETASIRLCSYLLWLTETSNDEKMSLRAFRNFQHSLNHKNDINDDNFEQHSKL